jgi:DNA-binding winged helix-turn-helix (wHTH) protein
LGAGVESKNMGIVERNRLLLKVWKGIVVQEIVRVTTARQTVVVHVYPKGESV